MGGPLRRPTKFDCGATLQQSSNIFYQKFLKIDSVGGGGEEKGFKGKRNHRSRLRLCSPRHSAGLALFLRIFCGVEKLKRKKK